MADELLFAIIIGAVSLFLGLLLDRISPMILETMRSKIRKLRWKAFVLKEYPNRDLIVKLKRDSEVKV